MSKPQAIEIEMDDKGRRKGYNYWMAMLHQKCPVCGISMLLLQPYFMRLSRTLWLSFFVKYNKDWQVENV